KWRRQWRRDNVRVSQRERKEKSDVESGGRRVAVKEGDRARRQGNLVADEQRRRKEMQRRRKEIVR
ncbi:hypothetical protein SOVF_034850 isoform A, partial [Spinacia oleracea]